MTTWIEDLLLKTSEAEAPRSFYRFSAYAAISAVVRKNVWLNKFYYKLYPNIYVMLMTDSGGRKGHPVGLAKYLVRSTNDVRIISGQNSIQSIVKDLSKSYTLEGGGMIQDAQAFIVSPEFHVLLLEDKSTYGILTELYNTHEYDNDTWEKGLSSNEAKIKLKNICLTILGASNDAMLKDALPEYAVEGGFIGRMLLVPDDGSGIINPLTEEPKEKFDPTSLVPYLVELSKLKGEFQYQPDAKKYYEDWYKEHRKRNVKDRTGSMNRLHDQILKVAMIRSLARGMDLKISLEDIEESRTECEQFVSRYRVHAEPIRSSEIANQINMVVKLLMSAQDNTLSKSKILSDLYGYGVDSQVLGRIIEHLETADWIQKDMMMGKITITLKPWVIERYNKARGE